MRRIVLLLSQKRLYQKTKKKIEKKTQKETDYKNCAFVTILLLT